MQRNEAKRPIQRGGSVPLMFAGGHESCCLGVADGLQQTGCLDHCRRRHLIILTDRRVARFGPTTPKRATTSLAASVDPTEARN
jgi:hypothetical protein